MSEIDEISIERMVKAVRDIDKSVKHFGIAFITKHTRFWLYRTLGRNTLPIYDSIMANTVMKNLPSKASIWANSGVSCIRNLCSLISTSCLLNVRSSSMDSLRSKF